MIAPPCVCALKVRVECSHGHLANEKDVLVVDWISGSPWHRCPAPSSSLPAADEVSDGATEVEVEDDVEDEVEGEVDRLKDIGDVDGDDEPLLTTAQRKLILNEEQKFRRRDEHNVGDDDRDEGRRDAVIGPQVLDRHAIHLSDAR